MANLEISPLSSLIGDDGGYLIYVIGDYFTDGTITNDQEIKIRLKNTSTLAFTQYLYSCLPGQGVNCQVQRGQYILCASPILEPGIYDLVLSYGVQDYTITAGVQVKRRLRNLETYELRASLPPLYKAGERLLNQDTVFQYASNALDTYELGVLEALTSSIGQELNTLKGNAKTRATDTTLLSEIIGSSDDVLLKLETNLGLEANQFIFVQGIKCLVTSIAGGATYIQTEQPFSTIQKGAEVTYATISN
jgi:hypothetical protein